MPRLKLYQNKLLLLRFKWSNPFVTASQWEHCVSDAVVALLKLVESRQWQLPASFVSTLTPADFGERSGTPSLPSKVAELLLDADEDIDADDGKRSYIPEVNDEDEWTFQEMEVALDSLDATDEFTTNTDGKMRQESEAEGPSSALLDPLDFDRDSSGYDDVFIEGAVSSFIHSS